MAYEDLTLERDGHVAVLTLNRPDKLNALTAAIRRDFPLAINEVRQDDDIRVLIVTGTGRGFSAGADISNFEANKSLPGRRDKLGRFGSQYTPLGVLEKPTIAAVNGVAVGAGLSIALMCDIRIASTEARFGSIWIKRALAADAGASLLLPQAIGLSRALELMFTGDVIGAAEAERIGLVSRVVAPDSLMPSAMELAHKIAKNSPLALELTKREVYKHIIPQLEDHWDFETYAQNICNSAEDFKEGIKAFAEKREPNYQGR